MDQQQQHFKREVYNLKVQVQVREKNRIFFYTSFIII